MKVQRSVHVLGMMMAPLLDGKLGEMLALLCASLLEQLWAIRLAWM